MCEQQSYMYMNVGGQGVQSPPRRDGGCPNLLDSSVTSLSQVIIYRINLHTLFKSLLLGQILYLHLHNDLPRNSLPSQSPL